MSALLSSPEQAAEQLRAGQLVAFPTETVYGLGADATNANAVDQVYAIKQRPRQHPLIVHIAEVDDLTFWTHHVPELAWRLAERYWPGPLTLVLTAKPALKLNFIGGSTTVAIRIPNHPLALDLLKHFKADGGQGLVGPSANRFGGVSPTSAQDVLTEFAQTPLAVVDGGRCQMGIESSVVAVHADGWQLLRPGLIGSKALHTMSGVAPTPLAERPPSPGDQPQHYAPRKAFYLVDAADQLTPTAAKLSGQGLRVAILQPKRKLPLAGNFTPTLHYITIADDAAGYAQQLYHCLRQFDASPVDCLLSLMPEDTNDLWHAIRDRLSRAGQLLTPSGH